MSMRTIRVGSFGKLIVAAGMVSLAACATGGDEASLGLPQVDSGVEETAPDAPPGEDAPIVFPDSGPDAVVEDCDADLMTSASNCGACGNVCNVPNAFPSCVEGKCQIASCAEGFHDLDDDKSNGCEYECGVSNEGVEVCDQRDNDCDGIVDNGFVLNEDESNCGVCGIVCDAVNADNACENGLCTYTCKPGFSDLGSTSTGGCFYTCPVTPVAAESCNGLDDNCDGIIDDGDPGGGVACHDHCPGGQCVGACQPGTTVCTGTSEGLVCTGGSGPTAESCDDIDNDCDGVIDNGFDFQNDPLNCGKCNVQCQAGSSCVLGKCDFVCQEGFVDLDDNPANGCEYACPVMPPVAETCNGKDDDCNGAVDDNAQDVGQPCDANCPAADPCVAQGNCSYSTSTCNGKCCGECVMGATVCSGGQQVCQGGGGVQLETCDGKDNDCDGLVDEGFNLTNDPLNCGACGNACSIPNAAAACSAGQCVIAACKPGFANLDNDQANGCEYTCPVNPPSVESCNGKDDNCNGIPDDNLQQPPNFCPQTSICAGSAPVCKGTLGWKCDFSASVEVDANGNLAAAESRCDGIDGNCNGQIDESFPNKGKPCNVGSGACQGSGNYVCSADFKTTVCPATADPTKAVDELCNGIDDNCDGKIDERTPVAGTQCYNGGQHACLGWTDRMVQFGTKWMYAYESSRPGATATDVGTLTDRACSSAGVQPWTVLDRAAAAAACASVKNSAGNSMRLCTAAEWTQVCSVSQSTNPIWSYATNPTTYQPLVCNGLDALEGKPLFGGAKSSCYANQSLGKVFDLSGNVAEWTSTTVTNSGKTYYVVKGGSFASPGGGMACHFDFAVQQGGFAYGDLGFRCCSDAAP